MSTDIRFVCIDLLVSVKFKGTTFSYLSLYFRFINPKCWSLFHVLLCQGSLHYLTISQEMESPSTGHGLASHTKHI